MTDVYAVLDELGLTLPPQLQVPNGVVLPFKMVQVHGERVLFSGHGPQGADGTLVGPFGKVGSELTVEEGYHAARLTTLSILASLHRGLGDLNRIRRWQRIFGMVNSASGFVQQPAVINGCSDLILEIFGAERGGHVRSAVGMAELPFRIPVEIEGELLIRS